MYPLVEIILSLGVLTTLVAVISACVCGCKNSNQKSELVGTAGVVKIHFDEEAPSPTPTTPASVKRATTQNTQRSLPEIPHPVGRNDSADTASDTYATVNIDEGSKLNPAPSTSRSHQYEHTYANPKKENQVVAEVSPELPPIVDVINEHDASQIPPEAVVISASVAISGQLPSSQELPYITPPSPRQRVERNPQHFSGDSTDSAKGYTSISVRQPLSNIRAALHLNKAHVQPHYATVSDDSDDTYAAIDGPSAGVRCDMYAQIASHDARRSLDREPTPARASLMPSDANPRRSAPPEIGVSQNATHSRQASSSSCSNSAGTLGSPKPEKRQANSPLPPTPHTTRPPNERGRSPAAQSFAQRQQRIASTGDLHFSHDKMRRSLNEKHQRNNSCVSSSDFYGCNYPVDKHRFSSGELIRPLVAKELKFDIDQQDIVADNLYNSIDGPGCSDYSSADANTSINSEHRTTESPSKNVEEMYAKVIKKGKNKEDFIKKPKDIINNVENEPRSSKYRGDDPGYETIDRRKIVNHGYETIAHKEHKISTNQDPGYETVKDVHKGANANLNNNNLMGKLSHLGVDSGPNSILSSDPGYEHISKNDTSASDSDPNYEVLRNQPPTPPYATIAPNYKLQPTYSVVNKKCEKLNDWSANNNDEAELEPNYESMPNEPVYTTGSESDPNYESVRPKLPNYESMNSQDPNYESIRRKDPKYESVKSKDSRYESINSKDPNYESVKYFEVTKKEPPYEKLQNKTSDKNIERSDSAAGYEKINVPKNRNSKGSINSSESGTVGDYFQV